MNIHPLPALGLIAFLAAGAGIPAQSRNAKLLGRFHKYTRYNDVWAFKSPVNGKEYCLLGVSSGISILDCSNPARPIERAFIRGTRSSTWRDVKSFGNYVYAVTENSGEGMMVVDMTRPDTPRLVTFWGRNATWRHSHNIAMDVGTGTAFVTGTSLGLLFVDVKTNPAAPKQIGSLRSPYMHDLAVQHGFGYLSEQNGNNLRIYDFSRLPSLSLLGIVRLPGARISHNVWPSWDDKIAVTTNETSSGPIGVFDISNKRAPKLLAIFRATSSFRAIPHNAYITDYVGHASYYTEGYRTFDLSDPTKPVEVGFYDTWPGTSGGFNGAWGATPALESGNVFISDMSTGLYIVKPKSSATYYGKGTTGTGGKLPKIWQRGAAWLGNARYQVNLRNARGVAAAVLILGGKATNVTVNGLNLLVDLASPPPILVTLATGAGGTALQPLPIPADPRLGGLVLYAQYMVVDPGSASSTGLSASKGMRFELFGK